MDVHGSNESSNSRDGAQVKIKACSKCKQTKSLGDFYKDNRQTLGKQSQCKACVRSWINDYYLQNQAEYMLQRARKRALKKSFECTITIDDITPLPTHCPVFGFELTKGNGQQSPTAYSLDRINNSKGYVPGNIVVMSYLANRLKNDGTAAQHERIAQWMRENGSE